MFGLGEPKDGGGEYGLQLMMMLGVVVRCDMNTTRQCALREQRCQMLDAYYVRMDDASDTLTTESTLQTTCVKTVKKKGISPDIDAVAAAAASGAFLFRPGL